MLDEFPALGRLDFFESALAFMAGYGLKSFLIAQSLNQIEKAYGQNNSILDNCHVRVSFATNDERTAKRVSDALGMATELRAMKNYAGQPAQPVARTLDDFAPGNGAAAADARRGHAAPARRRAGAGVRLRADPREEGALLRRSGAAGAHPAAADVVDTKTDATRRNLLHSPQTAIGPARSSPPPAATDTEDPANAGIRREPELPEHEDIVPEPKEPVQEFEPMDEEPDDEVQRQRIMQRTFRLSPARCRSIPATTCRCDGHADQAHIPPSARSRDAARGLRRPQACAAGP